MQYKAGYKYQLHTDEHYRLSIRPPDGDVNTDFIYLNTEGLLTIRRGYAWDGPSGPTLDTYTFMRGSLIHDALYQLMRMRLLPHSMWRLADKELEKQCKVDGMVKLRRKWVMAGLKLAGGKAAKAGSRRKILNAPKQKGIKTSE